MKINILYIPAAYKVKLWWFIAAKSDHWPIGIAEWERI